jgi:AraC family transcriptional regulator of adaptative response/methylated-DNA-[protein]-cysteine methyltransferase
MMVAVMQRLQSTQDGPTTAYLPDAEAAWRQIVERDAAAGFFYGVASTGVFCRPGCSSRRPLRSNVRLFASAAEARTAGFRACKRCLPESAPADTVKRIAAHLEGNLDRAVPLAELGELAGLSPFTVQRMFKQRMGVSPLAYQRALRASWLRRKLKQGGSVTDAMYEAGFGSSSRAYEGAALGMTPGRFAQGGRGETIGWSAALSPFGWILVGATGRGLCWLSIAGSEAEAEGTLRAEFPAAELHRDAALAGWVDAALATVDGGDARGPELKLDLRGTAFQLRVWQALRGIPRGETRSYSQLAREMGDAKSTRAVARACATNRVALVVPCHRVVGVSGSLTGYRWGVDRKRQLLETELLLAAGAEASRGPRSKNARE